MWGDHDHHDPHIFDGTKGHSRQKSRSSMLEMFVELDNLYKKENDSKPRSLWHFMIYVWCAGSVTSMAPLEHCVL
jgi:hypothetical protein